jgi:hypothetical protein
MCHQNVPKKSGRAEMNGTHQLLIYADINILDENISTMKNNTGSVRG